MSSHFFGGRASIIDFEAHPEPRGILTGFHFDMFSSPPCRAFVVTGVPAGTSRGGHAHRRGEQLFVVLAGAVTVELEFGGERQEIVLGARSRGVFVGPQVSSRQTYSGPDAQLLVFANFAYDPESYIHAAP